MADDNGSDFDPRFGNWNSAPGSATALGLSQGTADPLVDWSKNLSPDDLAKFLQDPQGHSQDMAARGIPPPPQEAIDQMHNVNEQHFKTPSRSANWRFLYPPKQDEPGQALAWTQEDVGKQAPNQWQVPPNRRTPVPPDQDKPMFVPPQKQGEGWTYNPPPPPVHVQKPAPAPVTPTPPNAVTPGTQPDTAQAAQPAQGPVPLPVPRPQIAAPPPVAPAPAPTLPPPGPQAGAPGAALNPQGQAGVPKTQADKMEETGDAISKLGKAMQGVKAPEALKPPNIGAPSVRSPSAANAPQLGQLLQLASGVQGGQVPASVMPILKLLGR